MLLSSLPLPDVHTHKRKNAKCDKEPMRQHDHNKKERCTTGSETLV